MTLKGRTFANPAARPTRTLWEYCPPPSRALMLAHLFELRIWVGKVWLASGIAKSLHWLIPDYLCSKFKIQDTGYCLTEIHFVVPLLDRILQNCGAVLWNSLPCEVGWKQSPSGNRNEHSKARQLWKAAFMCVLYCIYCNSIFSESNFVS